MKTRRSDHPRRRLARGGRVAISRVPLHEQVAAEIRRLIVSGALAPGEKVKVAELAEELDVSPTPLREALKVLDKENLVELTTNRGARVADITVEGTRSLFELIARLEALAAELAAQRITQDELAALESLHSSMVSKHLAGDLPAYFDFNRQIHDLVVQAAKNPDLTRVRTSLAFQVERARFLAVAGDEHRARSVEDHEKLMGALRRRDAESAQMVWRTHLERAGKETCRLVALWKEGGEATAAE